MILEAINQHLTQCKTARAGLPEGTWTHEPDRMDFKHEGMDCLLSRSPFTFTWCGYVAVPKDHPLYGLGYNDVQDIDVHGGLTYSSACHGRVCHISQDDDSVWWFGFDCGHYQDLLPCNGMRTLVDGSQVYRDFDYVRNETKKLADSLKSISHGG